MMQTIAVVLKGYPRLSESFIAQELLSLERAGFRLNLISLRHPTDKARHPIHSEIKAPVNYLPEYLHEEPVRVLKGLASSLRRPGFSQAFRLFLKDLARDPTRNRVRRFGQALVMARELPTGTAWIYAHFIHTPCSVARYCRTMVGLDWSCSAHAKDIWTSPDWELSEKLADMSWCVTCTSVGHRHLQSLANDPGRVHLVYHGLDLARFPHFERPASTRNGTGDDPVRILTVGRAVEKKGLDTLIAALAQLPEDLNWRWTHIGGGVLKDKLAQQIRELGLGDRAEMLGAKPQEFVLETCRESDLFVLPSRIAADGDRDGLPNVLIEAQSQGLACVSTPVSGIVELVEDGVNGLLTPPDDVARLRDAMAELISNPRLRDEMAQRGERKVRTRFDHLATMDDLVTLFEESGVQPQMHRHAVPVDA